MKKKFLIIVHICALIVISCLVFVVVTSDNAKSDCSNKKRKEDIGFEENVGDKVFSTTNKDETTTIETCGAIILEFDEITTTDYVNVYYGNDVTIDAELETLIESDPLSSDILSTAVYRGYVCGSSGLKSATIQIGSEGTVVVLSQGEKIGNSEWEVVEINPQYVIVEAGDVQRKLQLENS
jgi:hypothetical protein